MKSQIIILFILLQLMGCYNEDDYKPSKLIYNEILILTAPASSPADASSTCTIRATIPDEANGTMKITFKTNLGSFEGGNQSIEKEAILIAENGENKRIAEVKLVSPIKTGIANVEASIQGINRKVDVEFDKAYPESVDLKTSSLTIEQGFSKTVNFTTELLRSTGKPTINTLATIEVFDANNNSIGYWLNKDETTDENGKIINTFTLGNHTYVGILKVVATSHDVNAVHIIDSLVITAQ